MTPLLPVKITKMSGAGNTFAFIDGRGVANWKDVEKTLGKSRPEIAQLICDRVLGIATDGFIVIEDGTEGFDFNWDFYNSDGSTAEMCGNAARCAARYCYEHIGDKTHANIRFKTGAGLVTAQILGNGKIRVKMPEARVVQNPIELETKSSSKEKFVLVNTGVPHLVQKIHAFVDSVNLKDLAREMRSHVDLKPAGANVTFYAEDHVGKIKAVTFERGVEDYTLACGTGAVASALVSSLENHLNEIEVQMPGGVMEVHFFENDLKPLLVGDAVFVGDFQYNLEVVT
ncbi:diaminopimelate epimerase [Bdellovibrio sp. SKB1291214]|uniref:diaminopimelate epimerase n=1 Tax=Bdellovibrio sp. SKB1291214 TaxID=1732569 RepID=UPI000B51D6E9|nr:diaminopimelate epimerase [Bdellovibrio sp. SKB1291214]UYL10510.1 diaminopimelate epimerase [Bdellovibrio sp. SKB1291214]